MQGKWLISVVVLALLVWPIAHLSTVPAAADDADQICRESRASSAHAVQVGKRFSKGMTVIGSPINAMNEMFSKCMLARWNEPVEDKVRMIVFVYNNSSSDAILERSQLLITPIDRVERFLSSPVPIDAKGTGVFLFVGPIKDIALQGVLLGRDVQFAKRALPDQCGRFTMDQALLVIEEFQPNSTLRSSIPNLDLSAEVQIVRIQFDDSIVPNAGTDGTDTGPILVQLSTDRQAAAYIDFFKCS